MRLPTFNNEWLRADIINLNKKVAKTYRIACVYILDGAGVEQIDDCVELTGARRS